MRPKKARSRQAPAARPAPPERAASGFELRLQALGQSRLSFVLASVLLLIPCFWHSRIQAGDISSHIYNAWLAELIQSGKTTGLAVVPQTTNVLADLMLSELLRTAGAAAAQRITVSLAVLVFVWGAFAFVCALSGVRTWRVLPPIAILAYGWTFHMGFLNMYLSLGICLFAVSAAWRLTSKGLAVSAGLLAIAYVAHGLPVAWAAALILYRWIAARLEPQALPRLLGIALAAIVVLRLALDRFTQTRWMSLQILSVTGADQAWIYDSKYWAIVAGLLLLWTAYFVVAARPRGMHGLAGSIPAHIGLLTAAGIVILPTAVSIPGYQHVLAFIAQRMSLALGVCCCAAMASVEPPKYARGFAMVVAVLFFGLLYRDDAILNGYEDRMTAAVAPLKGQRVVTGIADPGLRVNVFTHMIDRACLGVCYSYGNYEPSTDQFRVRVTAENPFVASTYVDAWRLENGLYIVKQSDLPLHSVTLDAGGAMTAHELSAGAPNGIEALDLLH